MDVFHVPNALCRGRFAFLGSKSEMDHYAEMCHALALCLRGNVGSTVFVNNFCWVKNVRGEKRVGKTYVCKVELQPCHGERDSLPVTTDFMHTDGNVTGFQPSFAPGS